MKHLVMRRTYTVLVPPGPAGKVVVSLFMIEYEEGRPRGFAYAVKVNGCDNDASVEVSNRDSFLALSFALVHFAVEVMKLHDRYRSAIRHGRRRSLLFGFPCVANLPGLIATYERNVIEYYM